MGEVPSKYGVIWKGFKNMLKISEVIQETKKDFTRDRSSVIGDFLNSHPKAVILSYIKKTRGDAIRFNYTEGGKRMSCEYVVNNAKTLLKALNKNGTELYVHNNGKITEYTNEF